MKNYLSTLLFFLLSLLWAIPIPAQKMVVPGRTWWYFSGTRYKDEIRDREYVKIGLILGQENERTEKGLPCYAINPEKGKVVAEPLAWLSEENDVVTVVPNFDLSKYSSENQSNEILILSTFLGYWYGNSLKPIFMVEPDQDFVWNKDPEQKEFLLYDFSYKPGNVYHWPWSGEFIDLSDFDFPGIDDSLGGLEIKSIIDEDINLLDGCKRQVRTFNLRQEGKYGEKAKIIEGIGTVYMKDYLESFFPHYYAWYGFFIAPNSIGAELLSSSFYTPLMPILYLVEEADGTVLYVNLETYHQASNPILKDELASPDSSIYDLFGRKIQSPLPGSIYIKDGKKYIGR